ncbi:MAG: hypothetical protein EOP88_13560 [Verrucomicrobiaceae bacterium]|nr:MAG: hypothetical protein EOP88_13560 [Verrucomicrobiaceae bacterium]
MKTPFPVVIAAIVSSLPLGAQTARERAEELLAPAMERIYRNDRAKLWESFSESSRDRFRTAWLDRLVALRGFYGPEKGPPLVKKWALGADLESVAALDNRQFWETWLSEQYLRDHEYKAPTAPLAPWPKEKVPAYTIEAVAEEGTRLFIVIKASPVYQEVLLGTWKMGEGWDTFGMTASALRNPPPERFVWTASRDADGKERLDVPDMVIETFTREAAKLRTPIPGRQ